MADKRDILIRLLGEETVAKMADRAGKGLDRFGDSLDATEKDAKDLDRQIAESENNLKQLATAFARTSDAADRMDISKAMRRQQTELNRLTKNRKLLPDFTDEGSKGALAAASGFAKAFPGALRGALGSGPGAIIGGLAAAGLVPTLSAATAGAVVGGVGAGGVIGGIVLASKDSRVQAAGKELGEAFTADLEESGARFVQPTIRGIRIIQDAWTDVADEVDDVFAATSRYVEPLARGVGDFVREVMPGIRDAAEAAGPIIREISEGLPRLGRAISDVFSDFADDADEGASAVRWLFQIMEGGIRTVGGVVHGFAQVYRTLLDVNEVAIEVADTLWGWIPGFGGKIDEARGKLAELKGALDKGGESGEQSGDKIAGGLQQVEEGAEGAAAEIRSLGEILDDFAGKTLDARAANRAFEEAIDEATESLKENGRTLDENTPKGRANADALDNIARTAIANAAAVLAMTGDQEQANRATEAGRRAYIKAATAMGMERKEAIALADKLFAIPNINRTVKIKVVTKYETQGSVPGEHIIGQGTVPKFSRGGMVQGPGPKGVDSRPALLAPGEGVLTSGEIDSLGGPAGFERLRAAIRGGGSPSAVPAMAGAAPSAGGRVAVDVRVTVGGGGQPIERAFAEMFLALVRTGALQLAVVNGKVQPA